MRARQEGIFCELPYIDLAIHNLGVGLQLGIWLKFFVVFVFFVDEMIFLGSLACVGQVF
jgi:hypothetical protein